MLKSCLIIKIQKIGIFYSGKNSKFFVVITKFSEFNAEKNIAIFLFI